MLHVSHAASQYYNIAIRTVDSDIIVLAVYDFSRLSKDLKTLYVFMVPVNTLKYYAYIPFI